jgi:hypothetical protein
MVNVVMQGDRVRFEVEGWDKLWALKSQLEIPLSHIRAVRADPEPARGWWHGEHYRRLVIEVANPADVVKTLQSAIATAGA